jgi:hypothetical protein
MGDGHLSRCWDGRSEELTRVVEMDPLYRSARGTYPRNFEFHSL